LGGSIVIEIIDEIVRHHIDDSNGRIRDTADGYAGCESCSIRMSLPRPSIRKFYSNRVDYVVRGDYEFERTD
jgi:hypothetical protein